MKKKITVLSFIVVVLALAAGIVGAQDRPGGNGGNRPGIGQRNGLLAEVGTIIQEQTGLTAQEIRQQVADGKTLEQIITENGGDVEAAIAAIVQATTDRINQSVTDGKLTQERADQALANLEENVRTLVTTAERLNGGQRPGPVRSVIELSQILLEQAGLEAQQVREGLASSQSIADLITAAGGDVEAVIASTITEATTRINEAVTAGNLTQERADEMLSKLETTLTALVNGTGNFDREGMGRERGMVNAVAEATGLTVVEVAQQVRDGASLGSILTANGVNIDTFVDEQLAPVQARLDEQVQNGTLSQAVADARLNLRRVELTDALNRIRTTTPAEPAGTSA